MTGVGGIFPNYEDHLLDKKNISECFEGNFLPKLLRQTIKTS